MAALIILILLQSRGVFSFGEHLFLPIIEAPVYDVELKRDLIFSWQIDYDKEEIIVEIKHDISSRDDFRGSANNDESNLTPNLDLYLFQFHVK